MRHRAAPGPEAAPEERRGDDGGRAPDDTPAEAGGSDPLYVVLQQEAADAVRQAVAALPPLQREAVVLFEYQEMSLADIAAVARSTWGP